MTAWIPTLNELDGLPQTTGWEDSLECLEKYENCFNDLRSKYSVFELVMNLKFEGGNFFNAFERCGAKILDPRGFLDYWATGRFPRCLVVYTFRCFFENGNGNDFYKPASDKYRNAIGEDGNNASSAPGDFSRALRKIWDVVFKGDNANEFDQRHGVPRELFCSRCWLIKNFQRQQGNSNLCFAIRAYKDIKDKQLRLRPECYPPRSNGEDGCENHLKRLLTAPGCELEREYLSDFVDNGASDDVRFGWFTQLDRASRAIVSNLVNVVEHNANLCFVIDGEHVFPRTDPAVDGIKVKLLLRRNQSQTYWFQKDRAGRWSFRGVAGDMAPQPIWKVVGITKTEYTSTTGQEYLHEDVLGEMLSDCNLPDGYGVFLVNENRGRKSIYVPFSDRRLPVGRYSVYAYRYVSGSDFHVIYDKSEVLVNGVQPDGRSFEVTNENEGVTISVHGSIFKFGVNRRSPIRDANNRERHIEHNDPSHIFLSAKKWPLLGVDGDSWKYEVDGISARAITAKHLYKTGQLTFVCNGITYTEPKVTFVDFVEEEVFEKFQTPGVGETREVEIAGCGAVDGVYEIGADQSTLQKDLPGAQNWKLNIPIVREGLVFRTEDGKVVLSCPFLEESEMCTKDLAIEDLQKSVCISCCAPGYDHIAITSVKYCNGNSYNTHIPMLKSRAGFVFSQSRAYLAGRSGVNGDVRVRDLLSDQQTVESFIVEEIPAADGAAAHRKCQIRLYDPKVLQVAERNVRGGQVSIEIFVSYYSHAAKKVMRWLPSDGLDAVDGVKTFDCWTNRGGEYGQDQNGRWRLRLEARTMHQDINRVFRRGAVILAFIAEESLGGGNCNLISGGFCLFDDQNRGLIITGGGWEHRLSTAMHKRYDNNLDDLAEMLGIYTLRRYCNVNDYNSVNALRRGLRVRLDNLRANIKMLGRGADLYMNSFYNIRADQWSGYAYLAGWYLAERVVNEIEANDDRSLTIGDCMCFYSSTGQRVWHPLMISRRAILMADNNNCRQIWRQYYYDLSNGFEGDARSQELVDGLIECMEKNGWYFREIEGALRDIEIQLEGADGISSAIDELDQKVLQWRKLAEFPNADDVECGHLDAAGLLALTQKLRNVLLALEDIDDRMRSTANDCDLLFCDLLRMIDARNWILGPCRI